MVDGGGDAPATRRIGTMCGKYRLETLLGVGGMATVYAATDDAGGRVAIKMLRDELARDREIRARLVREARVANVVNHAGVVRVIEDAVAEDGTAFLAFELLEGETVDARCKRAGGRLGVDEVVDIARQLLDVLVAAHASGVVHRDIKPENLFLAMTQEGPRLKVLDFGLARFRESAAASGVTRVGARLGTPGFMAPEQVTGRLDEIDARTDLWAVGATMYALLSGKTVHEAATVPQILLAVATKPVPPLASVVPGLPSAVAATVDRALALERRDRFENASDMRLALDGEHGDRSDIAFAPTQPAFFPMSPSAAAAANPSRGTSKIWILVVALIALLLAALAFGASRSRL